MKFDLVSQTTAVLAFAAATLAATPARTVLDLQGFQSAAIVLSIGVGGIAFTAANKITVLVEHSDDGVSFAPVGSVDLQGVTTAGDGVILTLATPQPNAAVYKAGYTGSKRYLSVRPVFGGAHGTGTPLAGLLLLGDPDIWL